MSKKRKKSGAKRKSPHLQGGVDQVSAEAANRPKCEQQTSFFGGPTFHYSNERVEMPRPNAAQFAFFLAASAALLGWCATMISVMFSQ